MDTKNAGGDHTQPLNGNPNANSIPAPRGYALSGKIMLSAIVVLFTVVLFILFLHLYVRWHVYRRQVRRQRRRSRLIFATGGDQISSSVASRGLDAAVLNSLTVTIFSPDELTSDDEVAECAVCLSEFTDGEKVRVLPRCDHRFHIDCIDMWFCSHNSCPLCRSPVEIDSLPPLPPSQCVDSSVSIGSSSDSDPDPNPNSEVSTETANEDEELGFWSRILGFKRLSSRESRPVHDIESGEPAAV